MSSLTYYHPHKKSLWKVFLDFLEYLFISWVPLTMALESLQELTVKKHADITK
jgi:hypothetical protein